MIDSTIDVREGIIRGEEYGKGKKNPPVVPGDKTKNKNYEQTLTLSDLRRFLTYLKGFIINFF